MRKIPTIPLRGSIAGPVGFVLQFDRLTEGTIRAVAKEELLPGMSALLEVNAPHCTLSHAQITGPASELGAVLPELRRRIVGSLLAIDRIALIGGRFQALQASRPTERLQLAAILAAHHLSNWVNREAAQAAMSENLDLTSHQTRCLRQFGHPLALPDTANGEYNRMLHVSIGYEPGQRFSSPPPKPYAMEVLIADVRLARMGPRGIVEAYYDV